MVDQRLVNYIADGLKKGYTAQQLQSYLVSQGYNANDVSTAIQQAQGGPSKGKFFVFLLIILVLLGGIGTGVYFAIDSGSNQVNNDIFEPQPTTSTQRPNTQAQPASGSSPKPTSAPSQPTSNMNTVAQGESPGLTRRFSEQLGFSSSETTDFSDVRSVNDCDSYINERDECILDFSWNKDHVTFCDKIDSPEVKDSCISQHALRHEDKELCEQIENKYSREICVYFLLTTEKLREINVAYTIDARAPDIIYDYDLAARNIEQQVVQNQNTQPPESLGSPGVDDGTFPEESAPVEPVEDNGPQDILDNLPEEEPVEDQGPAQYNPEQEEETTESGATQYNPVQEDEEEEQATQYG